MEIRAGGETGKHVRFRAVCRKACGFNSRPAHKNKLPLTGHFLNFKIKIHSYFFLFIAHFENRLGSRPRRKPSREDRKGPWGLLFYPKKVIHKYGVLTRYF